MISRSLFFSSFFFYFRTRLLKDSLRTCILQHYKCYVLVRFKKPNKIRRIQNNISSPCFWQLLNLLQISQDMRKLYNLNRSNNEGDYVHWDSKTTAYNKVPNFYQIHKQIYRKSGLYFTVTIVKIWLARFQNWGNEMFYIRYCSVLVSPAC